MTQLERQSVKIYADGHVGMIFGAMLGAALAGIVGLGFAVVGAGNGGPALHMMAGTAMGALAGSLFALIRAKR